MKPEMTQSPDARGRAAEWLNAQRSGDMTPAEEHTFQAWLDDSADNAAAYEELTRLWSLLGAAGQDPRVMAAREHDARTFQVRRRVWWAAMAACLAMIVAAWTLIDGGLTRRPLEPGIGMEVPAVTTFARGGPAEFQTSVGQRTTVRLPDKSIVTLDTDTLLRVHDKPGERLVTLVRGRAYFHVAKDKSRPFIVAAGGHRVRALGTAFDVQVGPDKFEVTLIEGRVKVETPSLMKKTATTAQLEPGQRLEIAEDAPQLTKVDLRTETSWHTGRLTFARKPLAEAVAEMNRYSDRKIVFKNGAMPDEAIIGVFMAGDVESFAKAMAMDGLATVTAENEETIELTAN